MPLPLIDSPHNPRIVAAAKLLDRKARARTELYLIEGWRFVRTALEMQAPIQELYLTRAALEREGAGMMIAGLMASNIPIAEVSEAAIKRLTDTVTPQGIVAVVRRQEFALDQVRLSRRPLVLIADAIADPGNLGALIRIAGAAAADALLLISGCCDWSSPKVLRASMGSVFQVPMVSAGREAVIEYLERRHLPLAATTGQGGTSLYESDLREGIALAFGNEAEGVSAEMLEKAAMRLTIPMPGGAESLNVTAAAAIVVFEALRQRQD